MANDATSDLNKLIETCLDGRNGYRQAADHSSNPAFKSLFVQLSSQRDAFSTELQQLVRQLGGTPTESGSMAAGLHRAWIGMKDALTKGDRNIVAECIRGDESAIKQYNEVSQGARNLPPEAAAVVSRQQSEIQQALSQLRQLEGMTP